MLPTRSMPTLVLPAGPLSLISVAASITKQVGPSRNWFVDAQCRRPPSPLLSNYPRLSSEVHGRWVCRTDLVVKLGFRGAQFEKLLSAGTQKLGKRQAGLINAGMAATGVPCSLMESTPSWETLLEKSGGIGSEAPERLPQAKKRAFDSEKEVTLVFYRDNSSWCPYCERVWLQLEEKQIPYIVEKINMRCYGDKPEWFMRMVPSGLIPALQLDGKVFTESLDIMMMIEDRFADRNPLLPVNGTTERAAVDGLLRLEQLWNNSFSLVDAVYAPFLERIAASMPYWQGLVIRGGGRWPAVEEWFDAMDSRSSFQAVKSDDFTITHTLEPQIGPCKSLRSGAAYRDKINGKDGGWELPLKLEETAWGKDDGTGSSGAKIEAAKTVISNHEKVVGFAMRGMDQGERYREAVDLGFRCVANALLLGVDNVEEIPTTLPRQVAMAAANLRDKVGVPRDLSYPAARQLRAHLHWLVKSLGSDL